MAVDFQVAALRHFRDGRLLENNKRWPNADQLFGFSAECSLKAVMIGLGAPVTKKGKPRDPHHLVHIDRLWDEFLSFIGNRGGAKYAIAQKNPFSDWSVDQRYQKIKRVRHTVIEKHGEAAKATLAILQAAELDGIVR